MNAILPGGYSSVLILLALTGRCCMPICEDASDCNIKKGLVFESPLGNDLTIKAVLQALYILRPYNLEQKSGQNPKED